jgi:hypothetical protein
MHKELALLPSPTHSLVREISRLWSYHTMGTYLSSHQHKTPAATNETKKDPNITVPLSR